MADIFDPEPSTLLCDESNDLCFDDLEVSGGAIDEDDDHDHVHDHDGDENPQNDINHSRPWINFAGSEPLILLPAQSDKDFATLVGREAEYLPKLDYLSRLRCGELDLSARKEAFDWISKAHSYYSFGPLSLCLAVNYLDRFLSLRDLPRDKAWAVQLLAVACLSIAAKMEETTVPQSIELQVGDPKFVFEAKTIQRMEFLVLDTLNWKMNAITPCSFLEYSLKIINDAPDSNFLPSTTISIEVMNISMQLILRTIRGIDFLEFRPSEIAAAVAMSVLAETQVVDMVKAISCFIHLEKDRVVKCVEKMKHMSLTSRSGNAAGSGSSGQAEAVPQSPVGVLDSTCFSYKSDELTPTFGSSANSASSSSPPPSHMTATTSTTTTAVPSNIFSPETKRKKLDTTTFTSGL